MDVSDRYFARKRIKSDSLLNFGFKEVNGEYAFTTPIAGGEMNMTVTVKGGRIFARVFDRDTGDEYTLHTVEGSGGEFVGRVRADFESVLSGIAAACCEDEVFHCANTRLLIDYAKDKFGDELEFLWNDLPDAAILRRKDAGKWYAVFMRIKGEKLGLSESFTEVVNVHSLPENIDGAIDGKTYFRGYHMNKKHWLTIALENVTDFDEIAKKIDESYALAAKKK